MTVLKFFVWIILIGALVLAWMCIGLLTKDVEELQISMHRADLIAERTKEIVSDMRTELNRITARSEELERQLINLQNNYVRAKRKNEELAHKLIKGE